MVTLNEALDILRNSVHKAGTENVLLSLSLGRILAEDVITVSDFPPFNKSATDGFACRRNDLDQALTILGEVKAGETSVLKVEPGQCIKIMNGAMLPEGADCVIAFEHTAEDSSGKVLVTSKPNTDNIHYLGEEMKKGEIVIKKGILIRNKHIGILAANGIHNVTVYNQPLISVYSLGKELVEAEDIPEEAQIRNSNGPQIIMQLQSIGINAMYGGIIDDDQAILEIEITRSIEHYNGIIFSGGISGGMCDLVQDTLKKMGFKILFQKLKVHPWNCVLFAVQGDKFCIGLSGNPLSSFMQVELLVKPFIFQLMGHQYIPETVYLESGEDFVRKKTDMESVIPVKRDDSNKIIKVYNNNSGNIFFLSEMYGILLFPEGTEIIKKGEMTKVILF